MLSMALFFLLRFYVRRQLLGVGAILSRLGKSKESSLLAYVAFRVGKLKSPSFFVRLSYFCIAVNGRKLVVSDTFPLDVVCAMD